jgi:hypothetical protein
LKRRKLDRHDSTKRLSLSSSSAAAVSTTETRRRKRPDTISRGGIASTLNSEKSKRQHLSQPTQAATNVENVKSIVGLRYVEIY